MDKDQSKDLLLKSLILRNMRGISPGLRGNLKNISDINNSDIMTVTETHLNDNIDD